jgi:putative hemolysin
MPLVRSARVIPVSSEMPITMGMAILATEAPRSTERYSLQITNDPAGIRAAQRLRHQAFLEEFGAIPQSSVAGHDVDYFDNYCDHLVVRSTDTEAVVGTYRLLPPQQARIAGQLYSATEFDLSERV